MPQSFTLALPEHGIAQFTHPIAQIYCWSIKWRRKREMRMMTIIPDLQFHFQTLHFLLNGSMSKYQLSKIRNLSTSKQ
jgi:hypothetical protein